MPGHIPTAAISLAGLVAAVLGAVFATGCASPQPGPQPPSTMSVVVPVPLAATLATLRDEAIRLGGRVTSETADSFTADFGVEPRRVGVTTADALGAVRTVWHETEVHSSATYFARPTDEGTLVSVAQEAAWWHPDRRVWLRLPAGSAGFPAPR